MAARPDNIDIRDQVIATLLEEKRTTPAPVTNYDAIQKLTANFVKYIEEEKIAVPPQLLERLTGSDAATKIAFVKAHLCPRVNGLESFIRDGAASEGINLSPDKVDKCARFLRAMAEVSDS
jgi:hypothetical protein